MTFNRDAWEGRKPLVEPMPTTIDIGCVVWEQAPDDSTLERNGGIVVGKKIDEDTGEMTVKILKARTRNGTFSVYTIDMDASKIDRQLIEPVSVGKLTRAARQICRAMGERQTAEFVGVDLWMLETAGGLAYQARDIRDDAQRARAEHKWGEKAS